MTIREAKELIRIARERGLGIRIDTYPAGEAYFDGGEYGYWTEYRFLRRGKWAREYRTTSDFPYCSRYGEFTECNHDPDWVVVASREVLENLLDAKFVGITDEKIYCDATHRRSRK